MSERAEDLDHVRQILCSARIDAVCGLWHLGNRAVPSLRTLAGEGGEPRLIQVAEDAARAGEHLAAARDVLRGAIDIADACDSKG